MAALIDFRGFRLLAMSRVPVKSTTLVLGSDDGGRTMKNSRFEKREEEKLFFFFLFFFPIFFENIPFTTSFSSSFSSPEAATCLKMVGEHLHLAEHNVFGVNLHGPGDLEIHIGKLFLFYIHLSLLLVFYLLFFFFFFFFLTHRRRWSILCTRFSTLISPRITRFDSKRERRY